MYNFRIVKLPVLLLTGCYVETDVISYWFRIRVKCRMHLNLETNYIVLITNIC